MKNVWETVSSSIPIMNNPLIKHGKAQQSHLLYQNWLIIRYCVFLFDINGLWNAHSLILTQFWFDFDFDFNATNFLYDKCQNFQN